MTLTNPKPGGWATHDQIAHAEITSIGAQLVFALDGSAGGAYAPTLALIIGGAGLTLTTVLSAQAGINVSGGDLAVATDLFVGGIAEFFGAVTCLAAVDFQGATTFDTTATFAGNIVANNDVITNSTVHLTGTNTLSGPTTASGGFTATAPAEFDSTTLLNGATTVNGNLTYAGSAPIRWRVAAAGDADATYSPSTADIVKAPAGTGITANRVWIIDNVNAQDGQTMLISRGNSVTGSSSVTVRNSTPTDIATLTTTLRTCKIIREAGVWQLLCYMD